MNEKLSTHYDRMWESARSQFVNGDCQIDSLVDSQEDQRRGITLLARTEVVLAKEITDFQSRLKTIEPTQYYQPISDLHLTVLSIISCNDGFQLDQIESADYQKIIEKCLTEPMTIRLKGITASPSGVLVQGFPEGDGLEKLRDGLRDKFKNSDLEHSIDRRYRMNTAHLTIMRFRKPLSNSKELVSWLDRFRQHSFGEMQINQLNLVFNDWYQRAKIVKELATFELK